MSRMARLNYSQVGQKPLPFGAVFMVGWVEGLLAAFPGGVDMASKPVACKFSPTCRRSQLPWPLQSTTASMAAMASIMPIQPR